MHPFSHPRRLFWWLMDLKARRAARVWVQLWQQKNAQKHHSEEKIKNTQVTCTKANKHLMTSSPHSDLLMSCTCKHLLRVTERIPVNCNRVWIRRYCSSCPFSNTGEQFWMCDRSGWMESTYNPPFLEKSPAREALREEMFQELFLLLLQTTHRTSCRLPGKLGKAKWRIQSSVLLTWPASIMQWFIVLHFWSKKVTGTGMICYKHIASSVGAWRKFGKTKKKEKNQLEKGGYKPFWEIWLIFK